MNTASINTKGHQVVVQEQAVTSVDKNSNVENNNGNLSNPQQRVNIQKSSISTDLNIESINDDPTFHQTLQTGPISDTMNINFILSGHQTNSLITGLTEKIRIIEKNETSNLNTVDDTMNSKNRNSNFTDKCPASFKQRENGTEAINVANETAQNGEESVHQKYERYATEDSLKNQSQETSCSVLRSVTNNSWSDEHINNFKTEVQMERGNFILSENDVKDNSICERDNPEALMKLSREDSKHLPDYLQTLIEGKQICGDSYKKFSKPDWLDEEKFQRGQRFARDHLFGIMFSDLISLMILFAFRMGLEPLIFTGQSDTPFKAFRRYLSTNVRVSSWYDDDIWDASSEAHKNLRTVRAMHETTRKRMAAEVVKKVTLEDGTGARPMWTDLHQDIQDDFQKSCPFFSSPSSYPNEVHINQCDMAMTQFGFFGLVLVYPKMFGIYNASNEDLEGYIHFWRTISYLLGGEDRFNLCNGDLITVRQRCVDLIEFWVKPEFRRVSRDWIHMSRVMVQGVSFYIRGISFEVILLYLCKVLNIKAMKLSSSLTLRQHVQYFNVCFVFWFLMRFSMVWEFLNWLVRLAIKMTLNMRPERVESLKQRVYRYEMSGATSTR